MKKEKKYFHHGITFVAFLFLLNMVGTWKPKSSQMDIVAELLANT